MKSRVNNIHWIDQRLNPISSADMLIIRWKIFFITIKDHVDTNLKDRINKVYSCISIILYYSKIRVKRKYSCDHKIQHQIKSFSQNWTLWHSCHEGVWIMLSKDSIHIFKHIQIGFGGITSIVSRKKLLFWVKHIFEPFKVIS